MAVPPHLNTGGSMFEQFGVGTTPNPWFNIANQFTPRNLHDVIKWSRYITVQSPTITEVIRKLSTYPITTFVHDTKNIELKKKYEHIVRSLDLKNKICDAGFDFYTIGNVFLSVYFPIQRNLVCPKCTTSYNSVNADFARFTKYSFTGVCPGCNDKVVFSINDVKSLDIDDINLIKWSPENVSVNHNPITGESEYYYQIPGTVKRKIQQGDKLFVNSIPWGMVEAVKEGKDFKFDSKNLFHLKNISMGSVLEGLGLPPIISMYSLVFYQAVLRKANEAIATDYLAPLRAVFPQGQSANGDPVVSMSLAGFSKKIESALKKHKSDPNHILISPVPLGYQNLGGEGKSLLVSPEIKQAEETMLLGLGVSLELLSGTTNWTSSTVGLRMLENTMNQYTAQIQNLVDWVFVKISSYLNIEKVETTMTPFKLTDDLQAKQLLSELVLNGEGSMSTLFEAFGMDYKEELERKKDDSIAKASSEIEAEKGIEIARFLKNRNTSDDADSDSGFEDAKAQAHDLTHQVASASLDARRNMLVQIVRKDEAMANMVLQLLPTYGIDPETLMNATESAEVGMEAPAAPEEATAAKESDAEAKSPDPIVKEDTKPKATEEKKPIKKKSKGKLSEPKSM